MMMPIDLEQRQQAWAAARNRLLAAREPAGCWSGHLSDSALATALACLALDGSEQREDAPLAALGRTWLISTVCAGGGWGDTPDSRPNLPTTLLVLAALRSTACEGTVSEAVACSEAWARRAAGGDDPAALGATLSRLYGGDRTFRVPILFVLARQGMLGPGDAGWQHVPPLPFALALVPQPLLRLLRLHVVSYAIPALVSVGLAIHVRRHTGPARPWGLRLATRLLRTLARLQPSHGGYLDATPLTAFTAMALDTAGLGHSEVAQRCRRFIRASMRSHGAWPIDTNLRTWVTSLAAIALTENRATDGLSTTAEWLLRTQHQQVHPFTGAAAGGWAWTDEPGGVPDADDTAAALLALPRLRPGEDATLHGAARQAIRWLLRLQNADGGMPTFCRGWGRLPFDRSCPDLTAAALAAWSAWLPVLDPPLARRVRRAQARAGAWLVSQQAGDGSWIPLWFGSQLRADATNPTLGTARVVDALAGVADAPAAWVAARGRGEEWLLAQQQEEGGWGAGAGATATVEETAWAVAALAASDRVGGQHAACRGGDWLARRVLEGRLAPSPIGLYFSMLWYGETLYPLIWTVRALGAVGRLDGGAVRSPLSLPPFPRAYAFGLWQGCGREAAGKSDGLPSQDSGSNA